MRAPTKMAASKGPVVEWTVREQLILASAVQRSGDQNWVSVSRAVKPLVEDARPPDYFSQKNCALQYSAMLDKAKHPKRKRSSDSTPESGRSVTVEEQIVRQLTEKRMKELNSSLVDTRKEHLALKMELEQIDKGELDGELAGMWEKVQAELAVKESTDTKGSRSRKSSAGSAATAASGSSVADSDHQKRQKAAVTGGATAEKKGHKSPEKRSSSSHAATEAHGSATVSGSPAKEERMDATPLSESTSLLTTPAGPPQQPSPSTTSTPITPRLPVKKRNLESLPLTGSDPMAIVHDESPLPYPMTVPKEEKLQESIAASGGRLSQSLLLPLSPDMHIIVQQPNMAAIAAAPGTESDGTGSVTETQLPAQPQSLNTPLQQPPLSSVPSTPLEKPTQHRSSRDRAEDEKTRPPPPLVVKQEVHVLVGSSAQIRPKTVADALNATVPTPPAVGRQPLQTPVPVPVSRPPQLIHTTTDSMKIHSKTSILSVNSRAPPIPPPSLTASTVPPTSSSSSASSQSPSKQAYPHLSTTPSHFTFLPTSSSAMTVVSSVLSDPRLKTGPAKTAPLQPAAYQIQTTADKSRPLMTTKSRPVGEMEKTRISSGEVPTATSHLAESMHQKEQETPDTKDRPPKPTGSKPLQDTSTHVVKEHKKRVSETSAAVTPVSGEEPCSGPDYTPPPTEPGTPPVTAHVTETSTRGVECGAEEGVAKEEGGGEKAEALSEVTVMVEEAPSSPVAPSLTGEEGACEEKGPNDDTQDTSGGLLDEQVLMDASSSRRSSISELPSSPLTGGGGGREDAEGSDILPAIGRRQARAGSSKKLFATWSRKRRVDMDEGMSVESTDLDSEEEPSSIITSAAPSPAPSQGDGDQDGGMSKKQWKKAIMLVWRHAAQHKYANLFLHPVRDDDAPGYKDVIHRPMDLSSVKRNIETGVTTTDIEFQRDMLLMFQNAFMYNSSDHDVYDMAEKMRADVMQSIQDYLSTQLQLIVESSTPKVLRSSRDKEGRRGDAYDEGLLTPVKKRRTRADD